MKTFSKRIRFGGGLRERFQVVARNEPAAEAKRLRMQALADLMTRWLKAALQAAALEGAPPAAVDAVRATHHTQALAVLIEAAAATSDVLLEAVEAEAARLCSELPARTHGLAALGPRATFAVVADLLFKQQKRKGNAPRSIEKDRQRLSVVAPKLGKMPVGEITHAIAKQAMDLVPAKVVASRCLYEGLISRVLGHAVEIECIEITPLKPGFVSAQPSPKRLFQYLRVNEDAGLLTCREIPLGRRLCYALMSRESPRPEFLTIFMWADIDLESGLLTHLHKTPRARRWPVCTRVLRVLRAWRELNPDAERVFPDWDHRNSATQLRADLWTANQRRAALHKSTTMERRIGMKDAGRATFVTLAKRAGAPQHWILDRTGHCTDEMMARYDRMAREKQDTIRSWLTPLDELLGEELGLEPLAERYVAPWLQGLAESHAASWPGPAELSDLGQQVGQLLEIARRNGGLSTPLATSHYSKRRNPESPEQPKTATSSSGSNTSEHDGPAGLLGVGQVGGFSEDALSRLLTLAQKDKDWGLAKTLSTQLEALAAAQPDTGVISLAAARKRREENGGGK